MIRILALDVGTVRVGVAISDPLGMTAQPLEVIDRKRVDPIERVLALVAEHEVRRIVVGKPLQLDGEEGQAVRAVEVLVRNLRSRTEVPVEMWDERLTTAQAERLMIDGGVRRQDRRAKIDKVAAALILQSYLEANPQ